MLEEVSLRMYSILRITEIFEFLHNRTIEGEVYVDDKMKHNFEEYFQRYGTLC